jgi:hypothetical protein
MKLNELTAVEVGDTGTTTAGPRDRVLPGQSAAVTVVLVRQNRLKVRCENGFTWMINSEDFRNSK